MVSRQINLQMCYKPIPIAIIIKAANSFVCNIFMECNKSRVDVKNYEELKRGMSERRPGQNLQFYFEGADEQAAEEYLDKIFDS